MRVLICGGGVIGAAVAYFLSRRGVASTVIESTGIACAASGKSGGFLALDWCDGTPLESMARRSFALHAELADEVPGEWGYRRLETFGGLVSPAGRTHAGAGSALPWLSESVRLNQRLGSTGTTAQVVPERFTAALMQAAQSADTELRIGRATGLHRDSRSDRMLGVKVDGKIVHGDAVVIAMGPWSLLASDWIPLPVTFGLKGHSILYETGDRIGAQALFLEMRERTGALLSPEIMPRADGTTWACAISSQDPLPVDPAEVRPDPGAWDRLEALFGAISPVLAQSRIVARQACYRPVTEDGLPLVGAIAGMENVYVATGHSVWGILNAPATGEAVAELIVDGAAQRLDLSAFDPSRLAAYETRHRGSG